METGDKTYEGRLARWERLREMEKSGLSRTEIARREGLTRQRVHQILNKPVQPAGRPRKVNP